MKTEVTTVTAALLAAAAVASSAWAQAPAPAEPGIMSLTQTYCLAKDGNASGTSDAAENDKYDRMGDAQNRHGLDRLETYRKALTPKTQATIGTGRGKHYILEGDKTFTTKVCGVRITASQPDSAARLQQFLKVPFARIEGGTGEYMTRLANGQYTVLSGPDLPTRSADIRTAIADGTLRILTVTFYPGESEILYEALVK